MPKHVGDVGQVVVDAIAGVDDDLVAARGRGEHQRVVHGGAFFSSI